MRNPKTPKKILFVLRTLPFPVEGGDLIVFEGIAKSLHQSGFGVDVLCFVRGFKKNIFLKTPDYIQNIFSVPIKPKINFKCVMDWIFKGRSYIFNRFYSEKFSKKLLDLVKTGEYSVVVFEHSYMFVNFLYNRKLIEKTREKDVKTIINVHVLESLVLENYFNTVYRGKLKTTNAHCKQSKAVQKKLSSKNILFLDCFVKVTRLLAMTEKRLRFLCIYSALFRQIIKKEIDFLKTIERECFNEADKIVFLAEEEIEKFLDYSNITNKSQLFQFQPILEKYQYSPLENEEKNSICFLGTFSWIQNYDAVFFFLQEIFPLILNKNTDAKFYLVGKNAPKEIKALHNGKNIFFVGEKEDIEKEISKYRVFVVPLRVGGGTRIKIPEALCWGKAVVSTTEGIKGICAEDSILQDLPVLTADSPESFSEAILKLLNNQKFYLEQKRKARGFADKQYNFRDYMVRVCDIIFKT